MTVKTYEEYKQAQEALVEAIKKDNTGRTLELLEAIANYTEHLLQVF